MVHCCDVLMRRSINLGQLLKSEKTHVNALCMEGLVSWLDGTTCLARISLDIYMQIN
jgi:hypothetical protein